jgi:hypothetical protein
VNQDWIRQVWARAGHRCEYCHIPSVAYPLPFHIDHIIARQHGGKSVLNNLALACLHCNRHKGPNIAGVDQVTGSLVRLFHPRQDDWSVHFRWNGCDLDGRTSTGQVTIQVLAINDPDFRAVRAALMSEGAFLPN